MIIDRFSLSNRWMICAIFVLPMALLLLSTIAENIYPRMFREDGPIEYAQFAVYLAASVLAAKIGISFHFKRYRFRSYLYCLTSFLIFIVAMEEISWGQRIFEIESPDFFQLHNLQGETTLHNLDAIALDGRSYIWSRSFVIAIILYLSFAWLLVPRALSNDILVYYLVPSWFLSSYFVIPVLWGVGVWYLGDRYFPYDRPNSMAETLEFIWALGCLVFMILGVRRLRFVAVNERIQADHARLTPAARDQDGPR